jgi:hypothetical protein
VLLPDGRTFVTESQGRIIKDGNWIRTGERCAEVSFNGQGLLDMTLHQL